MQVFGKVAIAVLIAIYHSSQQDPEKAQTDPEDWTSDWSAEASSKKKANERTVNER